MTGRERYWTNRIRAGARRGFSVISAVDAASGRIEIRDATRRERRVATRNAVGTFLAIKREGGWTASDAKLAGDIIDDLA